MAIQSIAIPDLSEGFNSKSQYKIYNNLTFVINGTDYIVDATKVNTNVKLVRDISKQKANAADGEIVKDSGGKASSVAIDFVFTGAQHQKFLQEILPKIYASKGREKNPIGIKNGNINAYQLHDFLIESISAPNPSDGLTTISIALVEYISAVKKQAASSQSSSAGKKPKSTGLLSSNSYGPPYGTQSIQYEPGVQEILGINQPTKKEQTNYMDLLTKSDPSEMNDLERNQYEFLIGG